MKGIGIFALLTGALLLPSQAIAEEVNYVVTVKTANVGNAGTDSEITIRFANAAGKSDGFALDKQAYTRSSRKDSNRMEKNSVDEFLAKGESIDGITKLHVHSDNTSKYSGWMPEWFLIRNQATGAESYFANNNPPLWIGDDNGTQPNDRDFVASKKPANLAIPPLFDAHP